MVVSTTGLAPLHHQVAGFEVSAPQASMMAETAEMPMARRAVIQLKSIVVLRLNQVAGR
jgi:hypothetical protein